MKLLLLLFSFVVTSSGQKLPFNVVSKTHLNCSMRSTHISDCHNCSIILINQNKKDKSTDLINFQITNPGSDVNNIKEARLKFISSKDHTCNIDVVSFRGVSNDDKGRQKILKAIKVYVKGNILKPVEKQPFYIEINYATTCGFLVKRYYLNFTNGEGCNVVHCSTYQNKRLFYKILPDQLCWSQPYNGPKCPEVGNSTVVELENAHVSAIAKNNGSAWCLKFSANNASCFLDSVVAQPMGYGPNKNEKQAMMIKTSLKIFEKGNLTDTKSGLKMPESVIVEYPRKDGNYNITYKLQVLPSAKGGIECRVDSCQCNV